MRFMKGYQFPSRQLLFQGKLKTLFDQIDSQRLYVAFYDVPFSYGGTRIVVIDCRISPERCCR
uniref:Uncharacterized protein n=1 Tax=Candidatus Kentrum sp. TUN TaxID=2126343 RepID=A0A451A326_9GAMM|nr:MAG: hypothetical protein BECKTUN1418D_GA0071000_11238 [Candidatus Kentron sp. TUN]